MVRGKIERVSFTGGEWEPGRSHNRKKKLEACARALLRQQQVQLGDLLAQLVTFVFQFTQLITAHGDIECLGWGCRH
jgi:hypothetical protein